MEQKNIISIIAIVVILLVAAGFIAMSVYVAKPKPIVNVNQEQTQQDAKKQQALEAIKKDFPDNVKGVITFSGKDITVKTADGKVYTLWPPQPKSIYEGMGIKSGQQVEIQGKFLENNRLQWAIIK